MSDGFEDGYDKNGEKDLSDLNIRKIPNRKTAVALKESDKGKNVPRIAAAGRGSLADRILDLAFENGIKVREDSDLAEMLAVVELDTPIPSEAFMAVAEILSYIYRANGQDDPFDTLIGDEE